MKILLISTPIAADDIFGWFNPSTTSQKLRESVLDELLSLRILVGTNGEEDNLKFDDGVRRSSSEEYVLNIHFRKSFNVALANPSEPWSNASKFSKPATDLHNKINCDFLDSFSRERWDYLISYIVGVNIGSSVRDVGTSKRNKIIESFVSATDLMKDGSITSQGYEYLLKSNRDQVWLFAKEVLSSDYIDY